MQEAISSNQGQTSKVLNIKASFFLNEFEWLYVYQDLANIQDIAMISRDKVFANNLFKKLDMIISRNPKQMPLAFTITQRLFKSYLASTQEALNGIDPEQLQIIEQGKLLEFIRAINQLTDMNKKFSSNKSVSAVLSNMRIREGDLLAEVRHAATHKFLPNPHLTNLCYNELWKYLRSQYWIATYESYKKILEENSAEFLRFCRNMDKCLKIQASNSLEGNLSAAIIPKSRGNRPKRGNGEQKSQFRKAEAFKEKNLNHVSSILTKYISKYFSEQPDKKKETSKEKPQKQEKGSEDEEDEEVKQGNRELADDINFLKKRLKKQEFFEKVYRCPPLHYKLQLIHTFREQSDEFKALDNIFGELVETVGKGVIRSFAKRQNQKKEEKETQAEPNNEKFLEFLAQRLSEKPESEIEQQNKPIKKFKKVDNPQSLLPAEILTRQLMTSDL